MERLPKSSAAVERRFDELFERLYPRLLGLTSHVLVSREEAEDVLQEAFLKLSAESALLMRPDDEAAAWMRRVCINLAFNRLRTRGREQARLERAAVLDLAAPRDSSPSEAAERSEEQRTARAALATLPERQRACLLLRHSGYAYAEIAATLEIAVGSVGVILARAERAFREAYVALYPSTHPEQHETKR